MLYLLIGSAGLAILFLLLSFFVFGFFVSLFIIVSLSLILLILLQKSKSSLGMGSLGGGSQALFGGSGGQETFQKITWGLGAVFMGGSFILAIMKKPAESAFIKSIASEQAQKASQKNYNIEVPANPEEISKEQSSKETPKAENKTESNKENNIGKKSKK